MGPYVHRNLTSKWAVNAGFSPEDAKAIGLAWVKLKGSGRAM